MKVLQPVLAKLSRPRLYAPVARERLFKLLDELRAHPLMWVNGPPGAGKTTLVASWLDAAKIPALWYQLDSADSDAATFFYYLGHLSKQFRAQANTLPFLTPEYLNDLPGFTRRFFREFFACMPRNAVLVLDNAQEAASESLHGILKEAATQMPAGLNLVVLSRSRPPEELARLLANAELVTIDWQQLRLSLDETRAIIAQSSVKDSPSFAEIHQRIDGWVAGLVLLLAHLKRGHSERSAIGLSSKESLFAYFAGEIFDKAPPEHRDLLMKTALLADVTPEVAIQISGDPSAPVILEQLYRRQYFTDRRTDPELSYRYHDLFREFLLARAERDRSPIELRAWHVRVAEILTSRGDAENALPLLFKAAAWNQATSAILSAAPLLLRQGRWFTLQSWIRELPDEVIEQHPWVNYWLGTSEIVIDQGSAQQTLSRAHDRFVAANDREGQLLAVCGIVEATYYKMADFSLLDRWIPVLDRLLESPPPSLTEEQLFRAQSAFLTAIVWRQPGHPKFACTQERVSMIASDHRNVELQLSAGLQIMQISNLLGDWERSTAMMNHVMPAMNNRQCSPLAVLQWCSYAGFFHYIHGEDAKAWEWFRKAEEVALDHNLPHLAFMAQLFWSYSATVCGQLDLAEQLIEKTSSVVRSGRFLDQAQHYMAQSRLFTARGNRERALETARLSGQAAEATGTPLMRTIWHSTIAGIMAHFGCYDESHAYLNWARAASEGTVIRTYDARILLIDAYLSMHWRHDGRSAELIRSSLEVAKHCRTHYFYRLTVPDVTATMLDFALREGIDGEFVRHVIRELRIRPMPGAASELWPWSVKVRTLGHFQLEVDGRPLTFGRKTPRKPLALLQCLVAFGGNEVPEHQLADALWPDADGDDAHHRLALSLHRLRQLLGDHECIHLRNGKLTLEPDRVWVDALRLETGLKGDAATIYGDFLEGEPEEPWILSARQRLRRLLNASAHRHISTAAIRDQKETARPLS